MEIGKDFIPLQVELDAEMVKGFLEAQGIKVRLVQEKHWANLWIDRWHVGRGSTPGSK